MHESLNTKVDQVKSALRRDVKKRGCTNTLVGRHQVLVNNFRSSAGCSLIFLNHVEAEGRDFGQVSGGGMKTLRGQSMCESYDPGL